MGISNGVDNPTDVVIVDAALIDRFPNQETYIVCSFLENFCQPLDAVTTSDFKQQFKNYIDKHETDTLTYKMLVMTFNKVDWQAVDKYIKEQQNVHSSRD